MIFKRKASCPAGSGFSVSKLNEDEQGATAVEYGLIAGFIALAIVGAITAIGTTIRDDVFQPATEALQEANRNS